jgi:hypothetical protein
MAKKQKVVGILHEYAFDVTLIGVIRVRAKSLSKAYGVLECVDAASVNKIVVDDQWGKGRLTEVSLCRIPSPPFEVDGKSPDGFGSKEA